MASNVHVVYQPVSHTSTARTEVFSDVPLATQGRRPKWAPFTLKPYFLFAFFLATIVMIVVIEILYQKSQRDKGVFFAKSLDDFTTFETFCYRYLMAVISVIYGMIWASVDLNVKRLEPFYQLAKGATASDSLLLHYPFDFLAFVPIAAVFRRHWAVFYSGLALVLIFWVITPLQSALMATELVVRDMPTQFLQYQELLPFERQGNESTAQFFYDGYGISWLGQKTLPFTTNKFAAVPFRPVSGVPGSGDNETWTAVTRTYAMNISCTPGNTVERLEPGGYPPRQFWNMTNVDDTCNRSVGIFPAAGYVRGGLSTGFYTNFGDIKPRMIDYYGGLSKECLGSAMFLGILAESRVGKPDQWTKDVDITTVWCKSHYSYVDMRVTVDATTLRVRSAEVLGDPIPFTQKDKIVDVERFEGDLALPGSPNRNFFAQSPPVTTVRYDDWELDWPGPIVGYSIGMSPDKSFEDLKDPAALGEWFEKSHQLLFSNFVASLLRDMPENDIRNASPISGERSPILLGVVIIGLVARFLQAFFAVVTICFASLGVISFRRKANLFGDPDSLAAKMSLVAYSKGLHQDFDGIDESSKLKEHLSDQTYRLDSWGSNGSYRIDREKDWISNHNFGGDPKPKLGVSKPVRPTVIKLYVGILFTVFLIIVLGLLVFLYQSAQKNNGLPVLSNNQFTVQIIFSFIPTILATFLEPFWVLLTRYFCIYKPYTELHKGNASPTMSLGLKYTSIPPALIFLRALRAKHFILFSLSMTALLANLLAISLGGLFDSEARVFVASDNFTQPLSPLVLPQLSSEDPNFPEDIGRFVFTFGQDGEEHFIVANSNITQGTPLPPWVANDYYFLPFESSSGKASVSHKAITRGFGGVLDCKPIEDPIFEASKGLGPMVSIAATTDAGEKVRCNSDSEPDIEGLNGQNVSGQYTYTLGLDVSGLNISQFGNESLTNACSNILVIGWARAKALETDSGPTIDFGSPSTKNVTLICHQTLKTSLFEVTVDSEQRVQTYQRAGPEEDFTTFLDKATPISTFTRELATLVQTLTRKGDSMVSYRNSSATLSWPHYLSSSIQNTSFTDPSQPLASFDTLASAYGQVYSLAVAIIFGLHAPEIFAAETIPLVIPGTTTTLIQRIRMEPRMFYISATILSLNVLVAIVAYTFRPKSFLPRLPDTLASEIAYFHASQALKDVGGTAGMTSRARERHLRSLGHRYGFGVYVGTDGKSHKGVERSGLLL